MRKGNGDGSPRSCKESHENLKVSFVGKETSLGETLLVEIERKDVEWLLDVCRQTGRRAAFVRLGISQDLNLAVEVILGPARSQVNGRRGQR